MCRTHAILDDGIRVLLSAHMHPAPTIIVKLVGFQGLSVRLLINELERPSVAGLLMYMMRTHGRTETHWSRTHMGLPCEHRVWSVVLDLPSVLFCH